MDRSFLEEPMSEANVTINVRQVSAKAGIIDIQGEVSAGAEKALMDAYTQINGKNTRAIILNFTQMGYMNSSGIGLLVTLLIRINRQKQHLLAYGLSEHYQHIFKLTRLSDVIHLYDTEQDALKAEQTL
jgi:anti-sigma B factor antagonist